MLDLLRGAGYLIRGLQQLRKPGVRRHALAPALISALLFSGLIVAALYGFEALMAWLLPEGYAWLQWLLWPIFALAVLVVLIYGFALTANLLAAPFSGPLAGAVERRRTGAAAVVAGKGWWRDGLAAVAAELQRLAYFLLRALPLLILFVIPVVNLVAPFLWLLFGAWVLGMEYSAHVMENRGIDFRQQRARLKRRPLLVIGFGGTALLASMVPLLNFLVLPAGVAGATLMYLDQIDPEGAESHNP